jgi:hypothetical protein
LSSLTLLIEFVVWIKYWSIFKYTNEDFLSTSFTIIDFFSQPLFLVVYLIL